MKRTKLIILAPAILFIAFLAVPRPHSAIVGDIAPETEALKLGFRPGDVILSANETNINSWEEFELFLQRHAGEKIRLQVRRESGEPIPLELAPGKFPVEGLGNEFLPPIVCLRTQSLLASYGIKTGDRLISVNGIPVKAWRQVEPLIHKQDVKIPLNMDFISSETGQVQSIAVATKTEGNTYTLQTLGLDDPHLFIAHVKPRSLGAKMGIAAYDRILLIQGQPFSIEFDIKRFATNVNLEKKMTLAVVRGAEVKQLEAKAPEVPAKPAGGYTEMMRFMGLTSFAKPIPSEVTAGPDRLIWLKHFLSVQLGAR